MADWVLYLLLILSPGVVEVRAERGFADKAECMARAQRAPITAITLCEQRSDG